MIQWIECFGGYEKITRRSEMFGSIASKHGIAGSAKRVSKSVDERG